MNNIFKNPLSNKEYTTNKDNIKNHVFLIFN